MRKTILFAALATAATFSLAQTPPAKTSADGLTGPNGMTLYTFDKDQAASGKSMCSGKCAENWPPFYAAEGDKANGDFSIVTRDDGQRQWAYKGKPLYYWSKDMKAGDRTGDNYNNVWHVAK